MNGENDCFSSSGLLLQDRDQLVGRETIKAGGRLIEEQDLVFYLEVRIVDEREFS